MEKYEIYVLTKTYLGEKPTAMISFELPEEEWKELEDTEGWKFVKQFLDQKSITKVDLVPRKADGCVEYPEPVMRKTALMKLFGFPEQLLDRAYRQRGQDFAQKIDPTKKNSPIIFETEKFEKWRQKQQRMENEDLHKKGVMV